MANKFTKQETVFNEMLVEEFSPSNVHANQAVVREAGKTNYDAAGVVERRDVEMQTSTTKGRDITGQDRQITALTVPVGLSDDNIINVPFTLNSSEMKDTQYLKRQAKAAVKKLANDIDRAVSNKLVTQAGIVLTSTGEFGDYDSLARAETEFLNREIDLSSDRYMNLSPKASRAAATNIAGRESGIDQKSAYEKSIVPPVAGFSTHKGNILGTLAASTAAAVTVSGGGQMLAPTAFQADSASDPANDMRYQTLTLSDTSALVEGDAFTLEGVNSVGGISKNDTGERQTFRIISVVSGTSAIISPAIIPADGIGSTVNAGNIQDVQAYANVTTAPADNASLTILNTVQTQASTFFAADAVELFTSPMMNEELSASMALTEEKTDSGICILFARASSINELKVTYRLSVKVAAHLLDPLRCGVMIGNQTSGL